MSRVAVATLGDPSDVRNWSGIPSRILEAVPATGHAGVAVGVSRGARGWVADRGAAAMRRLGRPLVLEREPWVRREAADRLNQRLREASVDLVIANPLLLAGDRRPPIPTALWVDALVPIALDYTTGFIGLPPRNVARMIEAEREVLASADLIALASQWALDGLHAHYPDISTPAILLPFGPINVPLGVGHGGTAPAESVLSVGSEWERKGMDDLIEAVALARRSRPGLTLDIVGALPDPGQATPPWVRLHGWLRRDRPDEAARLDALFATAGAFALLSRAECYGMVYVEAGAHGLPAVGTRTGGVTTAVVDGVTGVLVPVGDTAAAAEALVDVLDPGQRARMGAAGRVVAAERSWESSVRRIIDRLGS